MIIFNNNKSMKHIIVYTRWLVLLPFLTGLTNEFLLATSLDLQWKHISDLLLAIPGVGFGQSGRIDMLRHIWRTMPWPAERPPLKQCWVLCGSAGSTASSALQHSRIWRWYSPKILKNPPLVIHLCPWRVVRHFESNYFCTEEVRFVVPLRKDPRTRVPIQRFLSLEHSLDENTWT